jgi:hypothetical protein
MPDEKRKNNNKTKTEEARGGAKVASGGLVSQGDPHDCPTTKTTTSRQPKEKGNSRIETRLN